MESIFRSEDVKLCQLIIPYEFSYEVIKALGNLECVQFLNKNENLPSFNRQFTKNIFWCEEIKRKIRSIKELIKNESFEYLDENSSLFMETIDTPSPRQFNNFEQIITSNLDQISASNKSLNDLNTSLNELVQYLHVLRCSDESILSNPVSCVEFPSSYNLKIVSGTISRSRILQFENFLWRACKGNLLFRSYSKDKVLIDPISKERISKAVFAVYLQGDQLITKVRNVCEVFRASLFSIPESPIEKEQIILCLLTRIKNVELIINKTTDQRKILLSQIGRNIYTWQKQICEVKAIFTALNMLQYDTGSKNLLAECWCPDIYVEKITRTLENIRIANSSTHSAILTIVNTIQQHPTYYKTNKLTEGFQNLVDAYSVGTYKEINPALFMIVTFPFLFAVMFGDFGHGFFVLLAGLYLVIRENELVRLKSSELLSILYSGRYIILLMGVFSIFTGILYNDAFSKSFFFFTSGWTLPSKNLIEKVKLDLKLDKISNITAFELDPKVYFVKGSYPLGIDPIWMLAKNKIIFINSFKMKTSIILGFFHMLFGIILSAMNHRYFYKKLEFYTEFIPQFIFFTSIFGYLVFLIIYKWIFFNTLSFYKPAILIVFINMFMNFGQPIPESEIFFRGQQIIQPILVIMSVICIPWMLIAKPYVLYRRRRYFNDDSYDILETNTNSGTPLDTIVSVDQLNQNNMDISHLTPQEDPEKGLTEAFIMQLIHTIEFCLGGISNTASYLRLWALSLAHSQLSDLLWSMLIRFGFKMRNPFGSFVLFMTFNIFLIFTISLLVVMEGLSTFLHAIRLHWIEFQNKFYSGGGKPLLMFSLKNIVENEIKI